MNKINYLLVLAVIILLIGNIFLYSTLNKQNSDIKKDILDIKKEQLNQQASQKEALQNLVTFNWKTYQNDKFGFSFKYPEYMNICDNTIKHNEKAMEETEKVELELRITNGSELDPCNTGTIPPIYITIKKNINNYKTAEAAFYKEFSDIDKSLNNQFDRLDVGKANAYGGNIVYKITEPRFTREENYGIIILKNDYIVKFSDTVYDAIFDDIRSGNKPIFDAIISLFRFSPAGLLN